LVLGCQLFKGTFYFCDGNGADMDDVLNKTDCLNKGPPYRWVNRKYNFDNLGQVLCIAPRTHSSHLSVSWLAFLADRTVGCAFSTQCRLSVCLSVCDVLSEGANREPGSKS